VEGVAPPLLDGRWGLETLAVCHAILLSAREGHDVAPADLLTDLI
jgi:phthalate 4,5-cis-dihydrodiol dehydrogenase